MTLNLIQRTVCSDGNGEALRREGVRQEGTLQALTEVDHRLWACVCVGGGGVRVAGAIPQPWRKPGYASWQQQEPKAYCQPSMRRNLTRVS